MFGDLAGDDLDTTEVLSNWDDIKREEKGRTSVFDGIPRSMPALAYAAKVGKKASKVGFDWPDVNGAFPKIDEESAELRDALDDPDAADTATTDELGDLLFAVVNVARHLHIDPELALRAATDKFRSSLRRCRAAGRRTIDRPPCRRPRDARRTVGRGQGRLITGDASGPGGGCAANAVNVCSHSVRHRIQRSSMTSSNTVVARHVDIAKTSAGTP